MPDQFELQIEGADKLAVLAARMKEAGDPARGFRKELQKALRDAAKPLVNDVKRSIRANLPRKGGLAEHVIRTRIGVRTRLSMSTAGVRIAASSKDYNLRTMDRGIVRHPLFGNRNHWYSQRIPIGWWSKPLESGAPEVREQLVRTIDEFTERFNNMKF